MHKTLIATLLGLMLGGCAHSNLGAKEGAAAAREEIFNSGNYDVIGITDGDTLTVLNILHKKIKIRIAAIDAPEQAQPFGQKAKEALSDLCFNKEARLTYVDTDRYGRTVADVSCNGTDAGTYLVTKGMAWVYDKYSQGHERLYMNQRFAGAAGLGLWGDLDHEPIAPWEWRKTKIN